jgi:hypothetical protein
MEKVKNSFNSKQLRYFLLIFLIPFTSLLSLSSGSNEILDVGKFSASSVRDKLPSNWKSFEFKRIKKHTRYTLVKDNGIVVVKASSDRSASGLIRKIKIDLKKYPRICWRWKISKVYSKGDITQKKGDDYPARIYIVFEKGVKQSTFFQKVKKHAYRLLYGEYPPSGAINYIWASNAPEGTIASNSYAIQSKMIVVQSGESRINTWIEEEQNVYEDYKKILGKEPPIVTAVGIMTDSDDTKESALSFYGDIVFKNN